MVFLNGRYWGVHDLRERIDGDYLASHHGVDPGTVDLLEETGDVILGDGRHYLGMLDYVERANLADSASYAYIQTQMDVENFATYCAFQFLFANIDWPSSNVKYWRPRTPYGRWRWILFDVDSGLGRDADASENTLAMALDPDAERETILLRSLLENATFRREFVNRCADILNTSLSPSHALAVERELRDAIASEMPRHMRRWGFTPERWRPELENLETFLTERPGHARRQLRNQFRLGTSYVLSLDVVPPGAGVIELAAATVDTAWAGEYFAGNPVTLRARPAPGWRFERWSRSDLPQGATITIDPAGDYHVAAAFAERAVVINEINYDSADSFNPGDWVEICNAGAEAVDLSGWVFKDGNDAHAFSIPRETRLAPGGYIVLCRDSARFRKRFPGVSGVLGDLGFGFRGSGEILRLFDDTGALVDSVRYGDSAPWPEDAGGRGPTLELILSSLDNGIGESWAVSSKTGTPGARNSATPAPGRYDRPRK